MYLFRGLSFIIFSMVVLSSFIGASSASEIASLSEDKNYIKNMPNDGVFKIVVLGDSLANGLYQGLRQINKDNDLMKTSRKSKVNTGLVRVDRYDWNKGARQIAAGRKYEIAIVLLGLNDLQTIREKGKAHHFQTEGWIERYIARTEKMMSDLKKSGMAVYWAGIPITSPKRYQEEYRYLNGIYREAAKKTGIRFVDTWTKLATEDGLYSPFWRQTDGKLKEIRKKDGVHFTPEGYQIFAGFVNDIIQSDIKDIQQTAQSQ